MNYFIAERTGRRVRRFRFQKQSLSIFIVFRLIRCESFFASVLALF